MKYRGLISPKSKKKKKNQFDHKVPNNTLNYRGSLPQYSLVSSRAREYSRESIRRWKLNKTCYFKLYNENKKMFTYVHINFRLILVLRFS